MWDAIYLRFSREAHMTGFLCIFFRAQFHAFPLSCRCRYRCFTFRIYCKNVFKLLPFTDNGIPFDTL